MTFVCFTPGIFSHYTHWLADGLILPTVQRILSVLPPLTHVRWKGHCLVYNENLGDKRPIK